MLGLLIRRSLARHWLSSVVTIASIALATGLLMTVVSLNAQAYAAFTAGPADFQAVLGARGSPLQLVLNAVFFLETSPGNLPWEAYEKIRVHPAVKRAVPYALGDSYRGFPVVGVSELHGHDAEVGSTAGRGLKVGDTFQATHGVAGHVHQDLFTVKAIRPPTGGPADRVCWIPLEAMWEMEGHKHAREVSAVLLELHSPQAGMQLSQEINREGHEATLAWPIGAQMATLFERLGWLHKILELVAGMVVLVACACIMASLTSALAARRQEFAILRALGAHRGTLFGLVTGESACLAGLGSLAGTLLYLLFMTGAARLVWERTGILLDPLAFHPVLLAAPVGITLLGALSGLPAALAAYSTEVAANL